MNLSQIKKTQRARITGFNAKTASLETRLREIGFAEGDRVELLHVGLFGRNPISIKLNDTLIAMRKNEASAVLIELDPS